MASMEVCFLASGERAAVLHAADFEGKTAKAVKQALAAKIGATRFRQRLFLEGDASEIPDDEVFASAPAKVQLVVMEFCPPDAEEDERMMSAARNNDTVGLEQLLKHPRSPIVEDEQGLTPLFCAARNGHVEPMRLLLEAGAEIGAERTKHWGKHAALHEAARNGHLDAVRFLVENGAEKDQPNFFGMRPLHLAAVGGHIEVAGFLVELGASKDDLPCYGTTPLHVAAQNGHLDMVRFLVEVGADKEGTNMVEQTPLLVAAQNGHLDVVRFLVESGACCHSTDEAGNTAWDVASLNDHVDVARFLFEH